MLSQPALLIKGLRAMFLHSKWFLAGGILCLLVAAQPSSAQEGPYLGLQVGYQTYQGDLDGNGTTLGLRGGYASSTPVSVELRAGYGDSRNYQLAAGVEYAFFQFEGFRPYVQVGWGWYGIEAELLSDQVRLKGYGPDIGLGFDYFSDARTSIGFGIAERFIRYESDDPRVRDNIDGRTLLLTARWNVYY